VSFNSDNTYLNGLGQQCSTGQGIISFTLPLAPSVARMVVTAVGILTGQASISCAIVYTNSSGGQVNVSLYGAKGDGVHDDTSAINAACTAAVAAGGGIVWFPIGTYLISSNLTLPAGPMYQFVGGASISIASTKVLTVNDLIIADPRQQIFTGAGSVTFGVDSQPFVYIDWWGTTNAQACVTAALAASIEVRFFNDETYALGSGSVGLTLAANNARLTGIGKTEGGVGLSYTGTGTAVLVGANDGSSFYEKNVITNVLITCIATTNIALCVSQLTNSSVRNCKAGIGMLTYTNTICAVGGLNEVVFEQCDFHGGAGDATGPTGIGISSSPVINTVLTFRACYVHYCSVGVNVQVGYMTLEDTTIESNNLGMNIAGTVIVRRGWYESNGNSNPGGPPHYQPVFYLTSTGVLELYACQIVMYPSQNVLFEVSGAGQIRAWGGKWSAGYNCPITAITAGANPTVTIAPSPLPLTLEGNGIYYAVVQGVTGMTGANGTWPLNVLGATSVQLTGATTAGVLGGSPTLSVIPVLFHGDAETSSTNATFYDVNLVNGSAYASWQTVPNSVFNTTNETLNWKNIRFPNVVVETYTFVQKSIAGTVSGADMNTAAGQAGGAYQLRTNGYIIDSYTYTVLPITGGSVRTQAYYQPTTRGSGTVTALDTGVVTVPFECSRGIGNVPVFNNAFLAVNYITASLLPNGAGQDLICEVMVAYGNIFE
jgi:hypothetical protein